MIVIERELVAGSPQENCKRKAEIDEKPSSKDRSYPDARVPGGIYTDRT
jgi:hypothetical protein